MPSNPTCGSPKLHYPRTIYLVVGTNISFQGDHHAQWPVAAYSSKFDAEAFCNRANASRETLACWRDEDGKPWWNADAKTRPVNEYDPTMSVLTAYDVEEIGFVA